MEKVKENNLKRDVQVETTQDIYKMFMENGIPKESLLSLGYIGLGIESKLEELPINERNELLILCENLKVVISEALKAHEYRDNQKMIGFLQMVTNSTDKLSSDNLDFLLMHRPYSDDKEIFLE